jgi:hypothetical protein
MNDYGEKPNGNYRGMTVNERLFSAHLVDAWDAAEHARNRTEMIRLLELVDLTPAQAEKTTDAVLANPKMYGF